MMEGWPSWAEREMVELSERREMAELSEERERDGRVEQEVYKYI